MMLMDVRLGRLKLSLVVRISNFHFIHSSFLETVTTHVSFVHIMLNFRNISRKADPYPKSCQSQIEELL